MKDDKEVSFEQQTYEFAKIWAKTMGRRDFLKIAATVGGSTLLSSLIASCQTATEAPAEAPAAATQAPAGGTPKSGGIIKIARSLESDTLDPQKTTLLSSHEIVTNVFDPLVYLDPAGNLYPALAESWEFSNENKTVTFKLRHGVNFHDGTPFNAEAVKYSVERQLAPETASPTAWMLGDFDRVDVIDEYTVAYNYKVPFVALWVGISYSYCAPISKAAVEKYGDNFGRNPVGTGPFKFVSWEPDKGITLEKYAEHTWESPYFKNQGVPYLDGAIYTIIPEEATRISSLQTGEIDVIHGNAALPLNKLKQLKDMEGIKLITEPLVGVTTLFINTTTEPQDNKLVRKAINHAIDKQKLIDLVLDGNATPAYSPVASAFSAVYHQDIQSIGYDYDVEKAKALMKEAGYEEGYTITFTATDSATAKTIAEIIKEDLAQININVEIVTMPWPELFAKGQKGELELVVSGYTYGEPDIVYQFCHSEQAFWFDRHDNPELDKLIEQQREEFDPEKRKALFMQIQETFVDEAYWAPLYEAVYAAAMRDYVYGLTIDHLGFHHLVDMWMDK